MIKDSDVDFFVFVVSNFNTNLIFGDVRRADCFAVLCGNNTVLEANVFIHAQCEVHLSFWTCCFEFFRARIAVTDENMCCSLQDGLV